MQAAAFTRRVRPTLQDKTWKRADGAIEIVIGLYLPSRANKSRTHWSDQTKLAAFHRNLAALHVRSALTKHLGQQPKHLATLRWAVHFTRFGQRKLDDDNLVSAFKSIRDGVAHAIGIDDGHESWTWTYAQVQNPKYGIVITIREKTDS